MHWGEKKSGGLIIKNYQEGNESNLTLNTPVDPQKSYITWQIKCAVSTEAVVSVGAVLDMNSAGTAITVTNYGAWTFDYQVTELENIKNIQKGVTQVSVSVTVNVQPVKRDNFLFIANPATSAANYGGGMVGAYHAAHKLNFTDDYLTSITFTTQNNLINCIVAWNIIELS